MKKQNSRYSTDNNTIMSKTKIASYIFLTVFFIATSFFTLLFLYNIISDKSRFVTLGIFPSKVIINLIILTIVYFILSGLRFYYILKTLEIDISFIFTMKLTFINMFITNITPFAMGGGFAQVYFLNKKGVALGDATAASTIRGFIPIIFFFTLGPIILLSDKTGYKLISMGNGINYIVVLIFFYIIFIYLFYKLINNTKIIKKIINKLLKRLENNKVISPFRGRGIKKAMFREIDSFSGAMKKFLKGNKKDIILSIVFSNLFLLSLFMITVVLINGLNYNVSLISIISMQIVVTFITYLAPTPGAAGVAEGGFTIIFSSFVGKENIIPITFSWRLFTIYIGMIIGGVLFYMEMIKNKIKDKKNPS